jgi:hypothetical protein
MMKPEGFQKRPGPLQCFPEKAVAHKPRFAHVSRLVHEVHPGPRFSAGMQDAPFTFSAITRIEALLVLDQGLWDHFCDIADNCIIVKSKDGITPINLMQNHSRVLEQSGARVTTTVDRYGRLSVHGRLRRPCSLD